MRAFICSRDDTVTRLDFDDASIEAQPVLEGVPVNCVAADGDRVIVGTQGAGALLSSDGGRRWERMDLHERDVFSVAIGPADGTLYAGTEPSRLFVLRDCAEWTELEALQDIPSRERWSFPPRPWTPSRPLDRTGPASAGAAAGRYRARGRDAERRRRRELQRPSSRREARRSRDHLAPPCGGTGVRGRRRRRRVDRRRRAQLVGARWGT
jgi:hypothetical protein